MKACILLLFLLPNLCIALVPGYCSGEVGTSKQQSRVRIHIGKLQHNIKIKLDKIEETNTAELKILDQLDQINRKLTRQKEKTTALHQRLVAQKELLRDVKGKVELAKKKRDELQNHILKRLRSFYMMGKTGILNVTFSKKGLPDLMLFSDAFENLIAYDKDIILQYFFLRNQPLVQGRCFFLLPSQFTVDLIKL
ncbi:MAG: hypothetical protein D3904_14130, partial [Candidatus Electrothrix sp. EH2]|nr:hypothetical protein [Candidatus Electrothrix sp. EH2]